MSARKNLKRKGSLTCSLRRRSSSQTARRKTVCGFAIEDEIVDMDHVHALFDNTNVEDIKELELWKTGLMKPGNSTTYVNGYQNVQSLGSQVGDYEDAIQSCDNYRNNKMRQYRKSYDGGVRYLSVYAPFHIGITLQPYINSHLYFSKNNFRGRAVGTAVSIGGNTKKISKKILDEGKKKLEVIQKAHCSGEAERRSRIYGKKAHTVLGKIDNRLDADAGFIIMQAAVIGNNMKSIDKAFEEAEIIIPKQYRYIAETFMYFCSMVGYVRANKLLENVLQVQCKSNRDVKIKNAVSNVIMIQLLVPIYIKVRTIQFKNATAAIINKLKDTSIDSKIQEIITQSINAISTDSAYYQGIANIIPREMRRPTVLHI